MQSTTLYSMFMRSCMLPFKLTMIIKGAKNSKDFFVMYVEYMIPGSVL